MKKFITISFLLFGLAGYSKPVIHFSYDGGLIKFLTGGTYSTVRNQSLWEWSNGEYQCTECNVSCKGEGPENCVAVYKTVIEPNPFTDPEQNLIDGLILYALNSGANSGSHSETITIQVGNNCPETYTYTITWNTDATGKGTVDITNILVN